jgi:hypothetical protein
MKRTVRKWLSLLMAFAIVLSLMPVALAEDENNPTPPSTEVTPSEPGENGTGGSGNGSGNQEPGDPNTPSEPNGDKECTDHKWEEAESGTVEGEKVSTQAATCEKAGVQVYTCKNEGCNAAKTEELPKLSHDLEYKTTNDGKHYQQCKREECSYKTEEVSHKYDTKGECECGDENTNDAVSAVITSSGSVTLDLSSTTKKTHNIEWAFKDEDGNYTSDSASVSFYSDDDDVAYVDKDGKVTAYGAGSTTIELYMAGNSRRDDYITVTVKGSYDGDVSVTIYSDTTYYLGDKDDKGGKSVVDKIDDYVYEKTGYHLDEVRFDNVTDTVGDLDASTRDWYDADELEDISFEPENTGTAEFDFEASNTRNATICSGTIYIKVEKGSSTSGGDIEYSASSGKDVSFDADDFEDFWSDSRRKGSREDLDYVTFSLPSSSTGVLYDGDGSKLKSSTKCYVSAGRNETDLDDVYFEPKSSKAGTVKINFSAYGEDDTKISGTVVITYLNGNIDDITYTTNSSGKVDLKAKDFTDVFKAATGSSSSSLTITFTSLPSNGTLTYGSKDTKVTKSTTFKTSGTGNKIADVTYTASGSKSDTVTYTAASGSTKITGKILFNSVAANISLTVPYTCTSASGITFSTGDFTSRASGLTGSHSLAFGQPSGGNGGLYYTAIASQIPAGTKIPVSTLNTVTYRPSSNGATTIAFIIYDASGLVAGSGSVTITVSGVTGGTANPGNPGNPGTTTPGGVDSFKDVNATAWYRTDLTRLVSLGIMAGRSPNKFAPEGTLNYGEALKLICKAVGVTQPEGSGAQWAANYKSYAVSQGWITSDVVLTDTITRTAIAQIGAKALGLSASSATPFPDTNDPYVAAMNTAGIILGNPDGNFNGSGNLKRSEICAIICRMLNYRDNAYNDQIPGWL